MLPTLARRAATQSPRLHPLLYRYQAKKTWPPDFERLSEKHKLRLERKYRRRSKLKSARPTWNKGVKLAQYGSILGVLAYGILGLDWDQEDQTLVGFRNWYRGMVNSIMNAGKSPPPPPRGRDLPQS